MPIRSDLGPSPDRKADRHHPCYRPPIPVLLERALRNAGPQLEFRLAGPPRAGPADLPRRRARLGAQLPEIEGRHGGCPLFLHMTECLTLVQPTRALGRRVGSSQNRP